MILIVDAGATKTRWRLVGSATQWHELATDGINAATMPPHAIASVVRDELLSLTPPLKGLGDVDHIYYYGAGVVSDAQRQVVAEALAPIGAVRVEIESDMLGAARALLGDSEGIACILGTGSNSCLYNGREIVDNVPALGYILGDEGSGASLGRRFLADLFKRVYPLEFTRMWLTRLRLDVPGVIDRVYRQPGANAWMARLAPDIRCCLGVPQVRAMVIDEFDRFFSRNVERYDTPCRRVGFVGSIAVHFDTELREAASRHGYEVASLMAEPLDGLTLYHTESQPRC